MVEGQRSAAQLVKWQHQASKCTAAERRDRRTACPNPKDTHPSKYPNWIPNTSRQKLHTALKLSSTSIIGSSNLPCVDRVACWSTRNQAVKPASSNSLSVNLHTSQSSPIYSARWETQDNYSRRLRALNEIILQNIQDDERMHFPY
jgi:hypothetical protein